MCLPAVCGITNGILHVGVVHAWKSVCVLAFLVRWSVLHGKPTCMMSLIVSVLEWIN